MTRAEKAKEYFGQGYACSQAVALAFQKETGVDKEVLLKATLPFGGGLGRLRLTCGALSGMAGVIGMVFTTDEKTPENKKLVYAIVQELSAKFKAQFGSLLCGELLSGMNVPVEVGGVAETRSADYYKKRSCADMVAITAQITEDYLKEQGII